MPPIARDAGPWTIQKLTFLSEYLTAYVQATQRIKRADVCFMDLCAGPGFDRNRESGEVVPGSPLRALELHPGFRRFILIDQNAGYTRQLRELAFERGLDRLCHIYTGDCNALIGEALRSVPQDGATFCFVDPAGIDVSWDTIRQIADHKRTSGRKVEQFVLFAYDMDLVRILVREGSPEDVWGPYWERRIDRAMPDTIRWRRIYEGRNAGSVSPPEARRRFAYLYWMGFKELGYEYVVRPRLLKSDRGNPLYFLFFASDHSAGDRIMSHVLQRPRTFEQLNLPILEDPYEFEEGEEWYVMD